jgi:anti-anti-sigma regulatory factor
VRSFGALLDPLLGLTTVGPPDEQPATLETTLSPEQGPGLDLDLLRSAVTDLAPGTAAALVMIEHAWAIGLGTAIVDAGGRMVAQGFLTRDALLAVGRELNAIVEAEVATERAAAIKGAALLDTLTTLAAAEEVQREAMATESSRHAVVILGLRGETDVGSTFLEVLKRYAAALRQQESRLMLVGVDPRVMRQMERTGVLAAIGPAQVFPVEEHVGLALQNALEAAESWIDAQEQAV